MVQKYPARTFGMLDANVFIGKYSNMFFLEYAKELCIC
jgi:hypothetical protein